MLIFVDGCDTYATENDILTRWPIEGYGFVDDSDPKPSGGRFGGGALVAGDSLGAVPVFGLTIPPKAQTPGTDDLFIGVSFYKASPDSGEASLFAFGNSALRTNGTRYDRAADYNDHLNNFYVQLNTNGTFTIYCEGDELATSTAAYSYGFWVRLEFKIAVDDTNGVFEMRMDETPIITFSGDTYRGVGPENISLIYFLAGEITNYFDDWVINDATGTEFNDYQGDLRIDTLFPNGDVSTDSTVTGGTTSNEVLGESTPDDADYVSLSGVGDRDVLDFDNLPDTPDTVLGVAVSVRARTQGTTGREYKVLTKDGADEEDGETRATPKSLFAYSQDFFAAAPDGSAWNATSVNALNVGFEVVS